MFQSRNRVVSHQDQGPIVAQLSTCRAHVLAEHILRILHPDRNDDDSDRPGFSEIMIAGEVAGRGIYRNVAINRLPRFFCIFNIRVDGVWLDMRDFAHVALPEERVFNIMNWPTWDVEIDFLADTAAVSRRLDAITEHVERECPFAASFVDSRGRRISGTGEGLVWSMLPSTSGGDPARAQLWHFKTKGRTFSVVSRAKPTPPRDPDAVQLATAFVDYAVTSARFEQGIEYLREMALLTPGRACTPEFVKWVTADALEEEWEVMLEMGAEERKVRNVIGARAREWLFAYLEDEAGRVSAVAVE